jgi:5'-nucleotidase
VDENGMFTGISGDRRVSDVMVLENGEYVPIDPQKEYTVAGSSYFLFESGDGNTVFKDCERVVEYGPVDVEALIKYFNDLGTIPESYRTPEGRITVK